VTTAIRAAGEGDREAVLWLLSAQLRDHGIGTPEADLSRVVDLLLCRPHRGRFLLAIDAGRPVGLVAVSFGFPMEHGGRGAWLEELYVMPDARGRGLGESLLRAALDLAAADGAVAIDLEIERGHERVERLYRRAGFEPLARARWARRLTAEPRASADRPDPAAGGCLCGAVRYEASGQPREISHCHCSTCRRAAGAPVVTWATYPVAAFRWTRGSPSALRSSPPVTRSFCNACGTALAFFTQDEPGWIDVTVASMDRAEAMWPHEHIWTEEKLPWMTLDDDLPRLPRAHGG